MGCNIYHTWKELEQQNFKQLRNLTLLFATSASYVAVTEQIISERALQDIAEMGRELATKVQRNSHRDHSIETSK